MEENTLFYLRIYHQKIINFYMARRNHNQFPLSLPSYKKVLYKSGAIQFLLREYLAKTDQDIIYG